MNWKQNTVTKEVMKYHRLKLEQAKRDWMNMVYLSENGERENLLALGKCQGIATILALTVEEVVEFNEEMEMEIRNG